MECRPVSRKACTRVEYEECEDMPSQNCRNQTFKEPFQERIHREKCLLTSTELRPQLESRQKDSIVPPGLSVRQESIVRLAHKSITQKLYERIKKNDQ